MEWHIDTVEIDKAEGRGAEVAVSTVHGGQRQDLRELHNPTLWPQRTTQDRVQEIPVLVPGG